MYVKFSCIVLLYTMVYREASMESLQDYVVSKSQKLIYWKDEPQISFDTAREDERQTFGAAQADDNHTALATLHIHLQMLKDSWRPRALQELNYNFFQAKNEPEWVSRLH